MEKFRDSKRSGTEGKNYFGKSRASSGTGSENKYGAKGKTGSDKKYGAKGKAGSDKKYGAKGKTGAEKTDDNIRLNKYLANAGICSRREADEFIQAGDVSINGKTVKELGTKVQKGDKVKFKGKSLVPEKKTYILFNKPKDVITTTDDPQGRKTVLSLINHGPNERIYPVGRLDRMSTGVLLLTNDGELTKKLTHPSHNKKKIYQVSLSRDLTLADMNTLAEGVELEDGLIQPDVITYTDTEDKREIGIEIHSGRNRIIRRMFEHLSYKVVRLDRVYFAGLTKKGLSRGRWRYLNDREISVLKRGSYE